MMLRASSIVCMAVAFAIVLALVDAAPAPAPPANDEMAVSTTALGGAVGNISTMPGVSNIGRARTNYALNCQGCHMASGVGTPGRVPKMAGFVSTFLEAEGGREYLVRVPGITNAAISDEELAELANWMLYTFDPGHIPDDFSPFTTEEIARNRPHSLTIEAGRQRARLLNEMAGLSDEKADPADRK